MNTYDHSVSLDISRCTGCTMCLKHCPTEAIRIHDGHAQIDPNRCIDCGVCIRNCPNKAKKATKNTANMFSNFAYFADSLFIIVLYVFVKLRLCV